MLAPRGRRNGIAFALGRIAVLAVAVNAIVLLGSGADASSQGSPATWSQ